METMAQDMELGFLPFDEFAVEPDKTVPKVEGDHGHGALLRMNSAALVYGRANGSPIRYASSLAFQLTRINPVEICQHH